MPGMSAHANPPARKDHLWVLFVIAACALLEMAASWVTIGAMSGFPVIGGKHGLPTDWTLFVTTEFYWGYALYSWLAGAPGRRSRRFAMCSAAAVFVLSLTGQAAAHLVKPGTQPPAWLVVFITSLPVLVLALIAILIHLRQLDREEAEEAARCEAEAVRQAAIERAEADERTALRAELEMLARRLGATETELVSAHGDLAAAMAAFREAEAERSALEGERSARVAAEADRDAAVSARESAQREVAEARTRAEALAQKLAAMSDRKARKASPANAQASARESAQGDDTTTELRALMELQADPELRKPRMGGELARRLGVSPATGRRLHSRLTAQDAPADPLGERSAADSDERSGERS